MENRKSKDYTDKRNDGLKQTTFYLDGDYKFVGKHISRIILAFDKNVKSIKIIQILPHNWQITYITD